MKNTWILGVGLLMAVSTSCSSYTLVNSEETVGTNLARFKTFRIASPTDGSMPAGMTDVTYYNIAAAIREQMVERGFVESPDAQLLVNFGITVQTGITDVPYTNTVSTTVPGVAIAPPPPAPAPAPSPEPGPAFPPGRRPQGPPPGRPHGFTPAFIYPRTYYTTYTQWIPTVYKEGTLIMDLVNLADKQMIYTASVATILDGSGRFQTLEGIAKAVNVLFSKFPIPIPK